MPLLPSSPSPSGEPSSEWSPPDAGLPESSVSPVGDAAVVVVVVDVLTAGRGGGVVVSAVCGATDTCVAAGRSARSVRQTGSSSERAE